MTQDQLAKLKLTSALNPVALSSATTTAGIIIDTKGYESLTFALQATVSTGTYTPLIESGDDSGLSDAAAVADTELLPTGTGQEATSALTASGTKKIGYRGTKRYVRLSVVSSGTVSGTVSSLAVLGFPQDAPVA